MAPFPDNVTQKVYVDYTTGRTAHTFLARFVAGLDLATIDGMIAGFLDLLLPVLPDNWVVTGTRIEAPGASITLPVDLPNTLSKSGSGIPDTMPEELEPRQVVWVGRSLVSGRRVRVGIFGVLGSTPVNFRHTPETNLLLGDTVPTYLGGVAPFGGFRVVDGSTPYWNSYANFNFNSYWETRARL